MTTQQLEILIEGQKEQPSLDFKASCPWTPNFVKDILAMSNLPDGGYIVIGVEEDGNLFKKKGVNEDHRKTYVEDKMRDLVGKYADPMVDFKVYFPNDSNGTEYVVIKVFSFREIPTICKRDGDDKLKVGTIYYRNTNRRMESAAVSNVNDLRDIIELSAVRLMQRRRDFGFIIPDSEYKKYESDIEEVNKLPLAKEIKQKGYCEISVTPLVKNNIDSISACLSVVQKAQVKLEWNLPVIENREPFGRVTTFEDGYQGISEYGCRKEIWRMHTSGHFYMLNALIEDWLEGDRFRGSMAKDFPSGQFLFFTTSVLNHLTQFYTFLGRLAKQDLYEGGVRVNITFFNTAGRQLYIDGSYRMPLISRRTTASKKISLDQNISKRELIEDSTRLSNEAILKVAEYFEFFPLSDSLLAEQNQFLKNK